ncbi:glycoside hydrolase family 13 protein [Arthrobacter mobilis]|uniref:Glycoside hydrolase family 13 protein n=1 Tax=Arthrobacter mobilis TaxID=2724944 RepID=A0A7X6K6G8_9MICC|nr:glycoside hydrolase family 13 protein [Arthrobacter mobilis]NKX55779.1 glycoside hydrolase family 13 protein [Arthrobacter mobilis]
MNKTPTQSALACDPDWWRQASVYQVYPRSFADADNDGLGDLKGVTSRIPYLASLGIDAVWLSPFYPSALADGGYDVDDYRAVDPRLGTLDDFDEMVAGLHAAGIRLIVDIVPNHSSDRHAWFREALAAAPGSPERDRYIFRDGTGPGGSLPPSDWVSHFGGAAWTRVPDGQWYLHLFAREQPDFNWDNPEVREDFLRTLRFWSDRGVDGFRVDVAHGLAKDLSEPLRSKPTTSVPLTQHDGNDPLFDRDEVHEIFSQWRAVLNEYNPPRAAVAEAWAPTVARRALYARPTELGQAFNFDLLEAGWDAAAFRAVIGANLAEAELSGASSTWVLSNHDVVRHASRYGLPQGRDLREWLLTGGQDPVEDRATGQGRARAAALLMLALPGSAYLYQGEELGLFEVADLPSGVLQDPIWRRTGNREKGRDGCRVPLPWNAGLPFFGFGDAVPHLPQPEWFADHAADRQHGDPASTLELYRAALRLRRELQTGEKLEWIDHPDPSVLHFARPGGWHSITNFSTGPVQLPPGNLVLASGPAGDGTLPADTTAWVLE